MACAVFEAIIISTALAGLIALSYSLDVPDDVAGPAAIVIMGGAIYLMIKRHGLSGMLVFAVLWLGGIAAMFAIWG